MFDPSGEIDPAARLTRAQLAVALTHRGYKTAPATLATLACRGGGPTFQKYGHQVTYTWADALSWAQSRLSAPIASTSELNAKGATFHAT